MSHQTWSTDRQKWLRSQARRSCRKQQSFLTETKRELQTPGGKRLRAKETLQDLKSIITKLKDKVQQQRKPAEGRIMNLKTSHLKLLNLRNKEKRIKKYEQRFKDLWNIIKLTTIPMTQAPKGKERKGFRELI